MAWMIQTPWAATAALLDDQDTAWVRLRWLAQAMGLRVTVRAELATIYVDPPEVPPLPSVPPGADVQPWLPVQPEIEGRREHRHPLVLDAVIRQFAVATSPRYRIRDTSGDGIPDTFCNIFIWDVSRALGAEVPHWVNAGGEAASPGAGTETDANGAIDWLRRHGPRHGWQVADAPGAVQAAQAGRPAVVCWHGGREVGHIAVLRPATGHADQGPATAQAGALNFHDRFLRDGFGDRGPLEWFVHE